MISRHWTGIVRSAEGDRYLRHLTATTFPKLAAITGFLSAAVMRRACAEGVEFRVVTEWESLAAIRRFAGEDVTTAVVPPEVQTMLVSFDSHAVHYEVVATAAEPLRR